MADETKTKTASQPPKDVMGMLEYYLVTKSPIQLPPSVKEWIVKFGPWIDLVLLIISLPALLLLFGVSLFVVPFAGVAAPGAAASLGLAWIVLLIQLVLMVAALPGLFARKMQGWMLVFYSTVVSLALSLIHLNVIGGLIGALISFYFLFQIRSYYK